MTGDRAMPLPDGRAEGCFSPRKPDRSAILARDIYSVTYIWTELLRRKLPAIVGPYDHFPVLHFPV